MHTIQDLNGSLHNTKDGRFAGHVNSGSEVTIATSGHTEADRFTPRAANTKGIYGLESENTSPISVENGWVTVRMGGYPHANILKGATVSTFTDAERAAAREKADQLVAADKPFTALFELHGDPVIAEVRGHGDFLLLKGSRSRGWSIDTPTFLAVEAGYGKQDKLAAAFNDKASLIPVVDEPTPPDFSKIPDYGDGYPPEQETVAAVFMVKGHDFGAMASARTNLNGCLFFATDIQRGDGIVNGYFWAPDDAPLLTSETSSMYVDNLKDAAIVRDYEPGSLSYNELWKTIPDDRLAGYAYALGR
ncbi:hypothetical protein ACFVAJ_17765 [Agromyces sp. NPDC057679]|uniref:hypothetical protein n=1 Tax=Agromyces sp. NPDC057679 TaxID=3346207 RepID=UPI00366F861C